MGKERDQHHRHLVQPQLPRRATTAAPTTLSFIDQPRDRDRAGLRRARSRSTRSPDDSRRRTASRSSFTAAGGRRSCPPQGFARGDAGFEAPAADGDSVQVDVAPDSERLQLLQPFPRVGRARTSRSCRILVKTKGKCTTDHISPAGPWLRFRGHLDKISDNMFLGAINAFTGEAGKGVNALTGEAARPSPQIARDLQGARAALGRRRRRELRRGLEPRARRHVAALPRRARRSSSRSFARIHETNLKKQGILPLTFAKPADYDLFEQAGPRERARAGARSRPASRSRW